MSLRSLVEINHDLIPHNRAAAEQIGRALLAYAKSGDPQDLPYGFKLIATRHHSEKYELTDILRFQRAI